MPQFRHFEKTNSGRLLGQDWKAKGKLFELCYLLHVDDGAFIFTNRRDMIKASRIIHQTMARFGLTMHVGRDGKPSKTEAMCHPPSLKECQDRPNDTTEEATCTVADGCVTFTRKFKCLGSWVTQDLRDDTDIEARIRKARAQVHGLVNIWRNKHMCIDFKKLLHQSLPLNTALWGAESWTLTVESERKLERFHHAAIRNVLNITMCEVEEKRITNRKLRDSFSNIRNIAETVKERQLTWLEHVLKMQPESNARKLVNAWVRNLRAEHHPQHNLRHSCRSALEAIGEIKDPKAPLKDWTKKFADLPVGHWLIDVKKRLRKWSAENDKTRRVERAAKKQRILQ
jgi:hypothetical protein